MPRGKVPFHGCDVALTHPQQPDHKLWSFADEKDQDDVEKHQRRVEFGAAEAHWNVVRDDLRSPLARNQNGNGVLFVARKTERFVGVLAKVVAVLGVAVVVVVVFGIFNNVVVVVGGACGVVVNDCVVVFVGKNHFVLFRLSRGRITGRAFWVDRYTIGVGRKVGRVDLQLFDVVVVEADRTGLTQLVATQAAAGAAVVISTERPVSEVGNAARGHSATAATVFATSPHVLHLSQLFVALVVAIIKPNFEVFVFII